MNEDKLTAINIARYLLDHFDQFQANDNLSLKGVIQANENRICKNFESNPLNAIKDLRRFRLDPQDKVAKGTTTDHGIFAAIGYARHVDQNYDQLEPANAESVLKTVIAGRCNQINKSIMKNFQKNTAGTQANLIKFKHNLQQLVN